MQGIVCFRRSRDTGEGVEQLKRRRVGPAALLCSAGTGSEGLWLRGWLCRVSSRQGWTPGRGSVHDSNVLAGLTKPKPLRYAESEMAKPIKETPILHSKDAELFLRKITQNENRRASKTEYDRVMNNYNKIKTRLKLG